MLKSGVFDVLDHQQGPFFSHICSQHKLVLNQQFLNSNGLLSNVFLDRFSKAAICSNKDLKIAFWCLQANTLLESIHIDQKHCVLWFRLIEQLSHCHAGKTGWPLFCLSLHQHANQTG